MLVLESEVKLSTGVVVAEPLVEDVTVLEADAVVEVVSVDVVVAVVVLSKVVVVVVVAAAMLDEVELEVVFVPFTAH